MSDRTRLNRQQATPASESSQTGFTPPLRGQNLVASPQTTPESPINLQKQLSSPEQDSESREQTLAAAFPGHDFSRMALSSQSTLNLPNNPTEQKGDRTAAVMRMPKLGGRETLTSQEQFLSHDFSKISVYRKNQPDPPANQTLPADEAVAIDVAAIIQQILNSLQTDPQDRSGRVKGLLSPLDAPNRQAVISQVQSQLAPQQQQNLQQILTELNSEQSSSPLQTPENSALDRNQQTQLDSNQLENNASKASNNSVNVEEQAAINQASQSQTQESDTVAQDTNNGDKKETSATVSRSEAKTEMAESNSMRSQTSSSVNGQTAKTPDQSTSPVTAKNAALESSNSKASVVAPDKSQSPSGTSTASPETSSKSATSQNRDRNAQMGMAQNNVLPNSQVENPTAQSDGGQIVIDQMVAEVGQSRQRFADRIAQGVAAIAANVQQQQQTVLAAGDKEAETIQNIFANARGQVAQIIANAQTQLQADAVTQQAALAAGHTTTLTQVETTFTSGQERAQNLGNTYADKSMETANNTATQLQSQIQDSAQEARTIGQNKAQVGGSKPEIAEAKAQVANDLASDTATKVTSGLSDAMANLRSTGPQTADSFRQQGQEASRQLGGGQSQVVEQLTTTNQETVNAIGQTVTSGNQALTNFQSQLLEQLSSLENNLLNQLQTQVAQQSQEISTAGQQAIDSFQQQGQQALLTGDNQVAWFNSQVAGMNLDPELAPEASAQAVAQVSGAYDSLITNTDAAFQQVDTQLSQAGANVVAAIATLSANASGQIQNFLGQAQAQVNQQVSPVSSQLANTVTQANTAGSNMVNQVKTGLDGQITQLDQSFNKGLGDYQAGLNEQATSALTQAREPVSTLPSRTDQAQARAEARAQQGFFERQWNDFVNMISDPGFLAGLITGLVLGVIVVGLVIAGVLTGGVAIIAAAAVVGALAALAGTIASNYSQGKRGWAVFDGALGNMIFGALGGAVGAVVGLVLEAAGVGLLGIAATLSVVTGIITVIDNVVHDRPWDQALLANMLLAGLLTWIGGKIAGRFGGRGGQTPEPTPDTPEPTPDTPEPIPDTPEPTPDTPEPTPDTPEPTPDTPEPTPSPRTLDELKPRLSEKARQALEQQQELMSQDNFRQMTDSLKDPDGTYNVERANQRLERRLMSEQDYNKRIQQRTQQYQERSQKAVDRVNNICDETDGTNRPNASIGDGTTEAAVRHEITTGEPLFSNEGHYLKTRQAINSLQEQITELQNTRQFVTDTNLLSAIDAAITRARSRIQSMQPALNEWNNRVNTHPSVWNPDGTSQVRPNWPSNPGPI